MATASRTRPAAGKRRPGTVGIRARMALDSAAAWLVPSLATTVIAGALALSTMGVISDQGAVAAAIVAALVLLLHIGMRPLLTADADRRGQMIAGGLAAVWLVACYYPFHVRIFPGVPLLAGAEVTAAGAGLPLRIPASGHGAVDLVIEGKLADNPSGGVAPPVGFHVIVIDGGGTSRTVEGTFDDSLRTQRLGRRGTTTVHQIHAAEVHVLANPSRGDLTVTHVTLEPADAQPVTLSAFAHPLPGSIVLGLLTALLVAGVVAFDRYGPVPETDGALTLGTTAVIGAAIIFWTSNAVHPDLRTLIGAAIFGGPLGFAAGALVWWVAKRVIVRPAA